MTGSSRKPEARGKWWKVCMRFGQNQNEALELWNAIRQDTRALVSRQHFLECCILSQIASVFTKRKQRSFTKQSLVFFFPKMLVYMITASVFSKLQSKYLSDLLPDQNTCTWKSYNIVGCWIHPALGRDQRHWWWRRRTATLRRCHMCYAQLY